MKAPIVLVMLAACSADDAVPVRPASAARDSAGIEIVTSERPLVADSLEWRLAAEPRVTIGIEDGDPHYLLDRVTGAVRLSDGRIVIANSGAAELRFYDASGRYLQTVGRRGHGPGEFQRPEHLLRLAGDSIVVWDTGLGPVTTFSADGRLAHRDRISPDSVMSVITMKYATEALTPLPDGSFLLHVSKRVDPHTSGLPPGKLYRRGIGFYRFQRDFSRVDSVGWYGGLTQMYLNIGGRRVYATTPIPPYARAASGGVPLRIYAGNGDPYEINVYDDHAGRVRVIRNVSPAVPIPSDVLERWSRCSGGVEGSISQFGKDMCRVQEAIPAQTHYPAYYALVVDSESHLWVQTHGDGVHVYDPDGRWLARLDVSGSIRDIGRDFVIVTRRDTMGVERVLLLDLQRGATATNTITRN